MDIDAALHCQTFFDVLADTAWTVSSSRPYRRWSRTLGTTRSLRTLSSTWGHCSALVCVWRCSATSTSTCGRRSKPRGSQAPSTPSSSCSSRVRRSPTPPVCADLGGARDAGPRDADGRRPRPAGRARHRSRHKHTSSFATTAYATRATAPRSGHGRTRVPAPKLPTVLPTLMVGRSVTGSLLVLRRERHLPSCHDLLVARHWTTQDRGLPRAGGADRAGAPVA